jgi:WD40 repeat protein
VAKQERVGADLPAHAEAISDLMLTPDKKTLVTADKLGQVKVWDVAKREARHTIPAHTKMVVAFAMSPDGKRFATVGMENVVKLWETDGGKELRRWDLHVPYQKDKPFVRTLLFTPDGKGLATANGDTTVYLLTCP